MKWVVMIAMALAMVVPTKRALFIFQQNRYETGRYQAWLKENLARLAREDVFYITSSVVLAAAGLFVPGLPVQIITAVMLVFTGLM